MLKEATRFIEADRILSKERRLTPAVKRTEKQVAKVFRKQGRLMAKEMGRFRALFESLREAPGLSDWLLAWSLVEGLTADELRDAVLPGAAVAMELGAAATLKDLDIAKLGIEYGFSIKNPRAVEYLRQVGADLVTNVNGTTRSTIRKLMVDAAENGYSYNRAAKAITDQFVEFAVGKPQLHIRSRAHLVAITELGNAYSESNLIVGRDMQSRGFAVEKSWLTTGDERVSDLCRSNGAQGWIDVDDTFASGHPRPLRFPGCRCDILTRVKQ